MIAGFGVGFTSTIHGYNPAFRDTGSGLRFDAFEMHAHHPDRPERFHSEQVPGTNFLDHQGHIIPQNAYAARLVYIASQLDEALRLQGPYDLANAGFHLTQLFPALDFGYVTAYIQNILIAMGNAAETIFVDQEGGTVEDRLGGYFSVINWNPVNISRAPSDNHRGGYPGTAADNSVAIKLLTDSTAAGITLPAPFGGFLQAHIQNLAGNADAFIAACNNCLPLMPQGFYKFNWAPVLSPRM